MTTATKTRKQSLAAAIRIARTPGTDLHRALCGLDGCPFGGWGETQQARLRVCEELPHPNLRSYTATDLIASVMACDKADRYRWID